MTTREEIIALAKECGFVSLDIEILADKAVPMFEAFYHAAQRQAYERAAGVCDSEYEVMDGFASTFETLFQCAKAIRALIEGDMK